MKTSYIFFKSVRLLIILIVFICCKKEVDPDPVVDDPGPVVNIDIRDKFVGIYVVKGKSINMSYIPSGPNRGYVTDTTFVTNTFRIEKAPKNKNELVIKSVSAVYFIYSGTSGVFYSSLDTAGEKTLRSTFNGNNFHIFEQYPYDPGYQKISFQGSGSLDGKHIEIKYNSIFYPGYRAQTDSRTATLSGDRL